MTYQHGDILFAKYHLERLLGRGAFGEVWLATHTSLNTSRAIKVLRRDAPGLGSTAFTDFSGRFQLEAQLADRSVSIELSDEATRWLAEKGYDEKFGARPLARVIQEYIKKPLADEVLFGKLKGGGHVRVILKKDEAGVEADKIGFEFVEGPVTPKPEKLPGARKRKPKSGGPSGGSKGPASRGPLVKV